jgi:hypothetical protein
MIGGRLEGLPNKNDYVVPVKIFAELIHKTKNIANFSIVDHKKNVYISI